MTTTSSDPIQVGIYDHNTCRQNVKTASIYVSAEHQRRMTSEIQILRIFAILTFLGPEWELTWRKEKVLC